MLAAYIIIFLFLFLLIIPVEIRFSYKNIDNPEKRAGLSLLFGLISFRIYPRKFAKPGMEKVKHKPPAEKHKGGLSKIKKVIGNRKFLSITYSTLRRLLSSLKPSLSRFNLRFGIGDPADTGMLWGLMGPAAGTIYGLTDIEFNIVPDFLDSSFDLDTEGRITIIPIEILFISLGFLFSPTVLKTYWFDLR